MDIDKLLERMDKIAKGLEVLSGQMLVLEHTVKGSIHQTKDGNFEEETKKKN